MVKLVPPNKEDLEIKNKNVSLAEIKFYETTNSLSKGWTVWYSVNWDKETSLKSGEADYVLFHPNYGYVIIEVKGGDILVEDGKFFTINQKTGQKHALGRTPFQQAEETMFYFRDFYVEKAKNEPNPENYLKDNKYFPLSYAHGVFFPDSYFKSNYETIQYPFRRVFDKDDYEYHLEWMNDIENSDNSSISPLEVFLLDLLNEYKKVRKKIPGTPVLFERMMGSNIKRYINLRYDLKYRERELERVNRVQDYLLNALKYKRRCLFRGSAGSGKTFIAMKKALMTYREGKRVLLLCFNSELREFIRFYIGKQLKVPYKAIQERLSVQSINYLLIQIINELISDSSQQKKLKDFVYGFNYAPLMQALNPFLEKIPQKFKNDALLVDEAQDIEKFVWNLFPHLLYYPEDAIYYVFYDEAQSIFIKDFSPEYFGLDTSEDLIDLTQNLRNTKEIAKFLEERATHDNFVVKYEKYSGIAGLNVSKHQYKDAPTALMKAITHIKKKYFNQEIGSEHLIIIAYNRLETIVPQLIKEENYEYLVFKNKNLVSGEKLYLVEPSSIDFIPEVKKELNSEMVVIYKTISSFKGLERNVVYLIIPSLHLFKKKYPSRYKKFIRQVYVGVSRAKFKLYFLEYKEI